MSNSPASSYVCTVCGKELSNPEAEAAIKHGSFFCGLHEAKVMPKPEKTINPVDLNLHIVEGDTTHVQAPQTPKPKTLQVKIEAVCSVPRLGWQDHFGCVQKALQQNGINLSWYTTAFWHKGIQQGFNGAIKAGADWILSLDYDTVFDPHQLAFMLAVFGNNPGMDALAAIQPRRGTGMPLMSVKNAKGQTVSQCYGDKPIKAYSAHFGMTLFRTAALKTFQKPWFQAVPDKDGEYSDAGIDPDIDFWVKWAAAGKTLYVDPRVRIGHLEVMVSYLDENMEQHHMAVSKWRAQHNPSEAENSLEQQETRG